MLVEARVTIQAPRAAVWAALVDLANAASFIRGIQKVEILDRPAAGLVGLKWRETRELFGQSATADKWITEAAENEFYRTRAESDGCVFISTLRLTDAPGGVQVDSIHDTIPQTLIRKVLMVPMGLLFRGVARRALQQDLDDIKAAVERKPPGA